MRDRQDQPSRMLSIDGLRGLSIIIVILYYFFQHILPGGFLVINLLLLIAGFLSFRYFYSQPQMAFRTQSLAFYRQRFTRIFFPMLAMIVVTISCIWLSGSDFFSNLRNMALSSLLFVNNFYQILSGQSYFAQAANPSSFTHLWFLSLYGQLLVLTPLLNAIAYRWHRKPVIAANILLVISVISAVLMAYLYRGSESVALIYYQLATRLFAYTFGGVLAFLLPLRLVSKPLTQKAQYVLNGIGCLVILLMCLMMCFMYGTQAAAYRYGMVLFTLLSAALLVIALQTSTIWYRILSIKPFVYLGQRALHFYLWFYPVHLVVAHKLTFISSQAISVLIQLVLIWLLAAFSYQLFDQQRWLLPFGQDFDWQATKNRCSYLLRHRGLYQIKLMSLLYALSVIVGVMGMFFAPETPNKDSRVLSDLMRKNLTLVAESKAKDKDTDKVINHIDGLSRQEALHANALEVTFIGDSILLAGADQVKVVFQKAVIEAEVGRQLYATTGLLDNWASEGVIKDTVVTFLGNNGTFTTGQLNDYIETLGTQREQFYVTTAVNRAWQKDVNQKLEAAAKRYGNVKVIDWASIAANKKEWFYEDGIHPNQSGALEMAKYIAKQVYLQR